MCVSLTPLTAHLYKKKKLHVQIDLHALPRFIWRISQARQLVLTLTTNSYIFIYIHIYLKMKENTKRV